MKLTLTHNVAGAISFMDRLRSQFPFAAALALTRTAQDITKALPAETQRTFEGGAVPFTKTAFQVKAARKDTLTAMVQIKPRQAEYLRFQIEGGRRTPKRTALRLPGVVQKTPEGNLPAGLIRQLVARAKAGRRTTKRQAKKFGVSSNVDLFYGDPKDGRPPGIYRRVVNGLTHRLIPVVLFPKQQAQYRKKFDFFGFSRRIADQRFPENYARAWEQAVRTAR